MGGQACVFYGAAEFSRDLDLLILADPQNLESLRAALGDLDAEPVAVPPFEARHLLRGHAVHFRCRRADVAGLRIDVMAVLRGVAGFPELWERRTCIRVEDQEVDLLAAEDLIRAQKTQRDKDWPMIRRLVERHFIEHVGEPTPERIDFWLRELRTPELLVQVAAEHPFAARAAAFRRPAVEAAVQGDMEAVSNALAREEQDERKRDRLYWDPLKRELEAMRGRRRLEDQDS